MSDTISKEEALIQAGFAWEKKFFLHSSDEFPQPAFLAWDAAIDKAIRQQGELDWNPTRPSTPIARELFECVQSHLHTHLAQKLQLMSAIGTALDWYHGVDGFFLIDTLVVTMDLACTDKEEVRADIIFTKKDATMRLWRVAKYIADMFNAQSQSCSTDTPQIVMHETIADGHFEMMTKIMEERESVRCPHYERFLKLLGLTDITLVIKRSVPDLILAVLGYHRARRIVKKLHLHVGDRIAYNGRPATIKEFIPFGDPRILKGYVWVIKFDGHLQSLGISGDSHLRNVKKL